MASIAQLGERQTEDLKVVGSIPTRGTFFINYDIIVFKWYLNQYYHK